MLDYHSWSSIYDKTRQCNSMILAKLFEYLSSENHLKVLDFGCGTGNYLEAIAQLPHVECYGVDASAEMLSVAKCKKIPVKLCIGNHKNVSFPDNYFDFIYVIDVLQHIPQNELHLLFSELHRVLKPGCPILLLTVSHTQLNQRTWNSYFPSAATIQKLRFPEIKLVCELGKYANLSCEALLSIEEVRHETIPESFVNHVCNKSYSVFHLLTEQEYEKGRKQLLADYSAKKEWDYRHGETIIVLRKNI